MRAVGGAHQRGRCTGTLAQRALRRVVPDADSIGSSVKLTNSYTSTATATVMPNG